MRSRKAKILTNKTQFPTYFYTFLKKKYFGSLVGQSGPRAAVLCRILGSQQTLGVSNSFKIANILSRLFASRISLGIKENSLFLLTNIAEYSYVVYVWESTNLPCSCSKFSCYLEVKKYHSSRRTAELLFASSACSCSCAVFIHQTVQRAVSHQGAWGFISQAGFVSLRGMELSSLHQATLERFSVVRMPVHGTAVIILLLEQKVMARKDRQMWWWVMRLTDLLSCLIAVQVR